MKDSDEPNESDPPSSGGTKRPTITLSGCPDELRVMARRAAERTLTSEGIKSGRLEIAFVDEDSMSRHHERWAGRAGPTDVLAFNLQDESLAGCVDGQLIVCESIARQEACARNTDWRGEILLYVVHGCLHLCGYDDHGGEDFERMHRREDELLSGLGWNSVFSGHGSSSRSPGCTQVDCAMRPPSRET